FIFLTTRHTWNMVLLPIPETEIYELLQIQRRRLITWLRNSGQRTLNDVLEGVVRVSAGTGIRLRDKDSKTPYYVRRWAFIKGPRSIGRFTVASSRDHSNDLDEREVCICNYFHSHY